ncbi:MAG: hypothetical protein D6689_20945 [Deltaproteobacteria bacterium]|nr:MAG: hypothetical protein D6689_20945 [Deltaproteobacteria bacterium]
MTTADRFDPFATIHKGIRRILFGLTVDAGRLDARDDDAVRAFAKRCRDAFELLRAHARIEDEVYFPALLERDPDALAAAGVEHGTEDDHMRGIEQHLDRVVQAGPGERLGAGVQLYRALSAFCADFLRHLAAEEEALVPAMWRVMTDDELRALEARARAHPSAAAAERWLAELRAALSPADGGQQGAA